MMKRWIGGAAILGCALLAFSIPQINTRAQDHRAAFVPRQTNILTVEGPAIHMLVMGRLPRAELGKLVTNSRTVRDHPDLVEYYRHKADRLQSEAEKDQQIARAFGDPKPLDAPNHFNIGRNARHYHVIAKESRGRAQTDSLLAALNGQAAQGEGCFTCHAFHGRGGKIGPDLALEGTRERSHAWLISHFKDPQALSPSSILPSLTGLTNRQLEVLTTFLQDQKEK
jgi:Cytochrome C oxidase, mono-heme subunit/FixO